MVKRVVSDEDHDDPWAELDDALQVHLWSTPFTRPATTARPPADDVPEWAPSWWKGDEEASQTFLRAQGVRLG